LIVIARDLTAYGLRAMANLEFARKIQRIETVDIIDDVLLNLGSSDLAICKPAVEFAVPVGYAADSAKEIEQLP